MCLLSFIVVQGTVMILKLLKDAHRDTIQVKDQTRECNTWSSIDYN